MNTAIRRGHKLLLILILSTFASLVSADDIHLTNGRVLRGKIIKETKTSITLNFRGLDMPIDRKKIEKIVRSPTTKASPPPPAEHAIVEEGGSTFFPLREGSEYKYQTAFGTKTFLLRRVGSGKAAGYLVFVEKGELDKPNPMLEAHSFGGLGLFRWKGKKLFTLTANSLSTLELAEPRREQLLLESPLRVGQKIVVTGEGSGSFIRSWTVEVVRFEKVTVRSGTYQCAKIEARQVTNGGVEQTFTTWLAKGVGIVKTAPFTQELVSYTPPTPGTTSLLEPKAANEEPASVKQDPALAKLSLRLVGTWECQIALNRQVLVFGPDGSLEQTDWNANGKQRHVGTWKVLSGSPKGFDLQLKLQSVHGGSSVTTVPYFFLGEDKLAAKIFGVKSPPYRRVAKSP